MMRRRKRVTMQLSSAAVDTSRRSSRWCTLKSRRVSQFHNRCTRRDCIEDRFIGPQDGREKSRLQEGKRGSPWLSERRTRGKEGRARDRPIFASRSRRTLARTRQLFRLIVVFASSLRSLNHCANREQQQQQQQQQQRRSIGEDPSRGKRKKKLAGSEI